MNMRIQLAAKVDEHGNMTFAEPARARAWAAMARGKSITITLERQRSRRSLEANSRYWAALVPFAREVFEQRTGSPWTKDAAHLALKLAFLGSEELVVNGVVVTLPKSTAKLDTEQFLNYTKAIEAWIAQEFQVNPDLIDMEASL